MTSLRLLSFLSVLSVGVVVARDLTLFESHSATEVADVELPFVEVPQSLRSSNTRGDVAHRRLQEKKKKKVAAGGVPGAKKEGGGGGALGAKKEGGGGGAPGAKSAGGGAGGAASQFLPLDGPRFDFVVGGFPKCGTTTLLKSFGKHPDVDMADKEQCSVASPGQADPVVHKKLDETLLTLDQSPRMKRAFKCPSTMYNYKSLVRMERHSPNAKFVVGMRHPVKMMQSFYNYRITEIRGGGDMDEYIPPLEDILESGEPWKGVGIGATRFELFLMQMGKTSLTPEQMSDFVGQPYEVAVKPTNFKVLIYNVDQLEDTDETRTTELRRVMQEFLELETPIEPFGAENVNHLVGKAGFPEQINICDDKWAALRAQLVLQGQKTAMWLRDHFIHSPDVIVANPDHFVQTLEGWGVDPCIPTEEAAA